MNLDLAIWGEFVLLKPASLSMTSHGAGIQLFRRARLESMRAGDFPESHLVHAHPMTVSALRRYRTRPNKYRVLTLCGEALYVQYTEDKQSYARRSTPPMRCWKAAVVDTAAHDRLYFHADYPGVLEFGRSVAACFPENPLLGIDVIKDAETGALYALEVNGGGNVWDFRRRCGPTGAVCIPRCWSRCTLSTAPSTSPRASSPGWRGSLRNRRRYGIGPCEVAGRSSRFVYAACAFRQQLSPESSRY